MKKICKINRNTKHSTKGVEASSYFVFRQVELFFTLKDYQFTVSCLQGLSKDHSVDLSTLVFFSNNLNFHLIRIQRISIRFIKWKMWILFRVVKLMRYIHFFFSDSDCIFFFRSKQTNLVDKSFLFLSLFRLFRRAFYILARGRGSPNFWFFPFAKEVDPQSFGPALELIDKFFFTFRRGYNTVLAMFARTGLFSTVTLSDGSWL